MRQLTRDEAQAHAKQIKKFRERVEAAKINYDYGAISRDKMRKIKEDALNEEQGYIKESGIFVYFGKLWKSE